MSNSESRLVCTPLTKIVASLEALAHSGCVFNHFKAIRDNSNVSWEVAQAISKITGIPLSFPHEERSSDYGYPADFKHRSVEVQMKILNDFFPNLRLPESSALEILDKMPLPENSGSEGLTVFPKWHKIMPTYEIAAQRMVAIVFDHFSVSADRIDLEFCRLERTEKNKLAYQHVLNIQGSTFGDFYVIPAQFGISHRGRSIRRALEMIEFCPDLNFFEFGLGIFEIGAMLLTHPKRIHLGSHGKNKDNLSMYCAGNVYDPKADGKFHFVPWYLVDGNGNLSVGYRLNDGECLGSVGTPSAFLPMPKQK